MTDVSTHTCAYHLEKSWLRPCIHWLPLCNLVQSWYSTETDTQVWPMLGQHSTRYLCFTCPCSDNIWVGLVEHWHTIGMLLIYTVIIELLPQPS